MGIGASKKDIKKDIKQDTSDVCKEGEDIKKDVEKDIFDFCLEGDLKSVQTYIDKKGDVNVLMAVCCVYIWYIYI
jgi:hypothetical protein